MTRQLDNFANRQNALNEARWSEISQFGIVGDAPTQILDNLA